MTKGAVLILGGRSDIGLAIAHAFAAGGHPVMLAARGSATLETDRADIALRHGVTVTLHDFDALDTASHPGFVDGLPSLPEIAVCAVGALGNQAGDEHDPAAACSAVECRIQPPSGRSAGCARSSASSPRAVRARRLCDLSLALLSLSLKLSRKAGGRPRTRVQRGRRAHRGV